MAVAFRWEKCWTSSNRHQASTLKRLKIHWINNVGIKAVMRCRRDF